MATNKFGLICGFNSVENISPPPLLTPLEFTVSACVRSLQFNIFLKKKLGIFECTQ